MREDLGDYEYEENVGHCTRAATDVPWHIALLPQCVPMARVRRTSKHPWTSWRAIRRSRRSRYQQAQQAEDQPVEAFCRACHADNLGEV